MSHIPASSALSRFRVLNLTRVRSGPTAVRQLADWGADVIKVEAPESIQPDGSLGAARATPDFQNLQRNERSLTLNLKKEDGRAIFRQLVEKADVVVENYRPDVKDRLGIDYESLQAINPAIILASISGFGQTGPYAKRPGFDQIAQGMGGLMSITGEPGRGPMRVGIPISDLCAGLFCAMGILVALLERETSGKGQWLHTSLLQAQVFMLDFQAARWLMKGEVPHQAGNNHPTSIPTGVFPTRDGHINLAIAGEAIWRRFCTAIDAEEWITDPEFEVNAKRSENRDKLNGLIAERFKRRGGAEWIEFLTEAGVPCGEINSIDQVFADPQVEHLGIAAEVDSDPFGPTRCVSQPMVLERTPSRIVRKAPACGEHTDEILRDLGFDDTADHRSAGPPGDLVQDGLRRAGSTKNQGEGSMTTETTDKILSRKEDGIGRIIFNNPERHNAVSLEMWNAVEKILGDFADDDGVRLVVLSGAGGKSLVSGADISKFETERGSQEAIEHYNARLKEVYESVRSLAKPTIAMIDGYCLGGGLALAVCCDLRFCSTKSKFGLPAARLGLGYPFEGLKNLVDTVGPGAAKDIAFSARRLDAEEAFHLGLVQKVLPEDELASFVTEYAATVAGNAPLTVNAAKVIVGEVLKDGAERDMDRCRAMVAACFASQDYAEGRRAFVRETVPRIQRSLNRAILFRASGRGTRTARGTRRGTVPRSVGFRRHGEATSRFPSNPAGGIPARRDRAKRPEFRHRRA